MSEREIQVWDPMVRLFHWSLALAFAVAWWSGESDYDLHPIGGYGVLGLVAFRVMWGLVGGRHARFGDFVVGPARLLAYLAELFRGRAPRYLGHNPAGGAMILTMLLTLAVISVTGVMLDGAENRSGPLGHLTLFLYTDLIKQVHGLAADLALILILAHLAGVLHASLAHGENLAKAMVTGRKRVD